VRKLLVAVALAVALVAFSSTLATAASPTFRLTILHYVSGCHVWQIGTKTVGPAAKIALRRGTKLEIRPNCPMDFEFRQVAGPKLALGASRTYAGTVRTIAFPKTGVYRLAVANVQSSEQQGLQTLGPDNALTLTVVVK
jgi:hypothetical protein